ncbi:MAG: ribonuclease P protein component [Bacteroidota bacterium]
MIVRSLLPRTEILRGYRSFSKVIAQGRPVGAPPVRAFYLVDPAAQFSVKVGFAVSRSVRKAVLRNRAKRLLRESYRTQKHLLAGKLPAPNKALTIVFMYAGSPDVTRREVRYGSIEHGVAKVLNEIAGRLN